MSVINEKALSGAFALVLLMALLFASVLTIRGHLATNAVDRVPEEALAMRGEAILSNSTIPPSTQIEMAERLIYSGPDHDALARQLLVSAIQRDGYQPFAWAHISYVDTRQSGSFNASAQEALEQSLQQCPLCDEDLMKWRLTFVLTNWAEIPEDIRLKVFEGADLLRWWHMDKPFLELMRHSSESNGIPFFEYQSRIDTPVRPEEVGR